MSDLYDLPNGWEWKELNDVSKKIFAGGDKPENVSEFITDKLNIPIYANGAKNNGLYGYTDAYKVKDECITISARGTIGFTVVRNEKFLPIVRLIVVIPNDDVLSKILKYYLDYELVENTGSSIPQLTVPTVKKLMFPLPPLSEQQRIVSKLDNLFEKIDIVVALHQKNMDEADLFMGSVLNDVFGELEEKYGKSDLKDIAIITMGQSPSSDTYNSNGDGIPFFQGKKEFGKLNPTVEKYCTEPKKVAKNGDILMSVRAPVGPTNIANLDCAIGRGLCSIRAKENQFTMYIYYFLNHFEKDIEKMGKGSTFSAINKSETETLKIPLPPLQIQQKVVKYLDEISEKIEKVKSVQKEKMDSLKALKASILDKAFRGEL
jgi:type I restriction enzyme S subunit